MVLGLLDQLQIFSQSYLIKLLGLLTGLGLLKLWHLIYPRLLTGCGMLGKLKFYGISGQIFGLIFSLLSNRQLWWFWVESLHKNIQLMLEFLKAPFFVLHFPYYTLMTFLMMLSVLLLSKLMILLSILSVISHLICGNSLNWLLMI